MQEDDRARQMDLRWWNIARSIVVPAIEICSGPHAPSLLRLPSSADVLLGRSADADLRIADPAISKRHARLSVTKAGRLLIEDVGSTNGIRVQKSGASKSGLVPGAHFECGETRFRFQFVPGTPSLRAVVAGTQWEESATGLTCWVTGTKVKFDAIQSGDHPQLRIRVGVPHSEVMDFGTAFRDRGFTRDAREYWMIDDVCRLLPEHREAFEQLRDAQARTEAEELAVVIPNSSAVARRIVPAIATAARALSEVETIPERLWRVSTDGAEEPSTRAWALYRFAHSAAGSVRHEKEPRWISQIGSTTEAVRRAAWSACADALLLDKEIRDVDPIADERTERALVPLLVTLDDRILDVAVAALVLVGSGQAAAAMRAAAGARSTRSGLLHEAAKLLKDRLIREGARPGRVVLAVMAEGAGGVSIHEGGGVAVVDDSPEED